MSNLIEVVSQIKKEEFLAEKKWLKDQVAELEPSGLECHAENILNLLQSLEAAAEKDLGISLTGELFETKEVNDLCPYCECEVDMKWNVREQGLYAICPYCHNKFMLCNYCPATDPDSSETCDYDPEKNSCRYKQEV